MQIIGGALRIGGGGEDRALVVLQDCEPVGDIAGVIRARLGRDAEIGAEKGGTKLGDQFLGGIAFIAPALAAEFAGEARGVPGPVSSYADIGISSIMPTPGLCRAGR